MKVIHSSTTKVDSEFSEGMFIESLKARLGSLSFKHLVKEQNVALHIKVDIVLEGVPSGGTYVTKRGLKDLEEKLEEFVNDIGKDAKYEDYVLYFKAHKLLNEVRAAKTGWK